MNTRRFALVFLLIAVAAGGAAFLGWRKAGQLENENQALRVELAQIRADLGEAERLLKESAGLTQAEAATQKNELMRLRNEVTQLRAGSKAAEALRAENSQLQSQLQALRQKQEQPMVLSRPSPIGPGGQTGRAHFPREDWKFAGYDSPENALVSAIWAMREGRPEVYLDSLSPEEQERMAQVWQNQTEDQVAAKHQQDVSQITGMRIMTSDLTAANEMQMTVMLDGLNRMEQIRMRQVNGQWKFGGFIREGNQNP